MALIECPVCGKRIADRARVCLGCGTAMEEINRIIEEMNKAPKILVCPECGTEFEETEEVCPECGLPTEFINIDSDMEEVYCLICGVEYSSDEMQCRECGYPKFATIADLVKLRKVTDKQRIDFYIGKLMAECNVVKRDELALCDEPFDNLEAYKKIISFADESIKEEINGYLNCINERNTKDKVAEIYNSAKELMSPGYFESLYSNTAKKFESIQDYEDSKELAKECYEEVERYRIKRIYKDAVELMQHADTEEAYLKVEKEFESIQEYEDSTELAQKCHEEAEVCRKDDIYIRAKNILSEGKESSFKAAVVLLNTIPGWKDADEISYRANLKLAEVGEYIKFGRYEQGSGVEPIEWQVLDRKDNKALIISRYGLDCKKYNERYQDITWEKCTLRGWLNNEFMSKAFNSEEQAAIATTLCTDDKNPKYSTIPGNDTKDKIFLLSIKETEQYFKSDEERMCVPIEYTKSNGVSTSNTYTAGGKATCWWWLRSPGSNWLYAAGVSDDGSVGCNGHYVGNDNAVRPALWINLES